MVLFFSEFYQPELNFTSLKKTRFVYNILYLFIMPLSLQYVQNIKFVSSQKVHVVFNLTTNGL